MAYSRNLILPAFTALQTLKQLVCLTYITPDHQLMEPAASLCPTMERGLLGVSLAGTMAKEFFCLHSQPIVKTQSL